MDKENVWRLLMFSIEGLIFGESQRITYTNDNGVGKLTGDPVIVLLVEDALKSIELTGPVGQYLERDINDPLAVLFVIRECFHSITGHEGGLPEAAPIPEGAR
jgi:hypothetical protein